MTTTMKKLTSPIAILMFFICLWSTLAMGATTLHYTALAPMPTGSVAAPTSVDGISLTSRSAVIHMITLTNTGSSDYTFTIHDCQGTPAQFVKDASPITAGQTIVFNYGDGVRASGCFKWLASNVAVYGAVTFE